MNIDQRVELLSQNLKSSAKALSAIGDETRQHLIISMLEIGNRDGVRVGEIVERANLSRPAVSHHLKIMKDAGIIKARREGTKNYYYFDPNEEIFKKLIAALSLAIEITNDMPDRSGDM